MSITEEIINLRKPKTTLPVLKPISDRFSPRVFADTPITDNEISIILEAARLAPSGRNHQPWLYLYAKKGSEGYEKLSTCFPERNHIWASKTPLLIAATYDPKDPMEELNDWAQYDLGQASLSMVLQAQSLDIYCRQIGSFDREKFKEEFSQQLNGYEPLVILALGHIGGEEDYSKAPKEIVEKDLTDWNYQNKNQRKEIVGIQL
jgi:nitroreductase